MKLRIRFGVKMNIPFFRNLAIFVVYLTETQYEKLQEHVAAIQGLLVLSGKPEYASMLIAERS